MANDIFLNIKKTIFFHNTLYNILKSTHKALDEWHLRLLAIDKTSWITVFCRAAIKSSQGRIHLCYFAPYIIYKVYILKNNVRIANIHYWSTIAKLTNPFRTRCVSIGRSRNRSSDSGVRSRPGGGARLRYFLISTSYCSGRIHSRSLNDRRKFDNISENNGKLIFLERRSEAKCSFLCYI